MLGGQFLDNRILPTSQCNSLSSGKQVYIILLLFFTLQIHLQKRQLVFSPKVPKLMASPDVDYPWSSSAGETFCGYFNMQLEEADPADISSALESPTPSSSNNYNIPKPPSPLLKPLQDPTMQDFQIVAQSPEKQNKHGIAFS